MPNLSENDGITPEPVFKNFPTAEEIKMKEFHFVKDLVEKDNFDEIIHDNPNKVSKENIKLHKEGMKEVD